MNLDARRGLFASLDERTLQVYQIHVGQTKVRDMDEHHEHAVFRLETAKTDGWLSVDGWCAGCYLHGLFENDHFRYAVVEALTKRRFPQQLYSEPTHFSRQREYDRLADALRQHLDLAYLKALCHLEN
jgi:adenosylcobyric acid synthase